ncbi:MAG: Flp pilus assembly protein CpaB [Alphaproteobacteria bacterium]|nr:MAG: Flp pilus assembly protein CpaB [Alphaproteobacteria bacterium]
MNPRSIALIAIAIVIAGIAAVMARSLVREQPAAAKIVQVEHARDMHQILVAAKPLPVGRLLEAADVKWQAWPEEALNERYFQKSDAKVEDLMGKVVRHSIAAGEPIVGDKIVGPGEQGFLAAILTPGMRAVTVAVNQTTGIAGFIFPGDRVDLILTHEVAVPGGNPRQVSETVLHNVRILAVDQNTNDQSNQPRISNTVTLEVTPKIAEKIAVLRQLGNLSLSLRSLAAVAQDAAGGPAGPALNPKFDTDKPSYTWDADVSALLPKVGGSMTVSRGAKAAAVEFGGPQQ